MASESCNLSKDKVWTEKPSYDRAECQFYEKKDILPVKPLTGDELSPCGNNSTKKNKKTINKQNSTSSTINNESNNTEATKSNKKKNKKKEAKAAEALLDNVEIKNEDSEISQSSVTEVTFAANNMKLKAKEAKEKKNKSDKNQKISDDDKPSVGIQENENQESSQGQSSSGSLVNEVAKARAHIRQSLQCMDSIAAFASIAAYAGLDSDFLTRIDTLKKENQDLRNTIQELKSIVTKLDSRVKQLEGKCGSQETPAAQIAVCPAKPAPKKEEKKDDGDGDDDVDLFGSDSEGEDAEAQKIRDERLAAYAAKKSKKPALVAKSSLILDVKPWDDDTNMKLLETEVRKIECEGLLWGASKLVPVAYNIKKLQITCVVEDDKVSIDWLTEQIEKNGEYVQSVDIAAFNKI